VVLVSIDTLRPDHLGAYGYERATSPNLDALARDGVLFESAWAPSPWTLPSHASMLTGLSPYRHGAVARDDGIRPDVPLLAETLREHGYATVGMVSAPFVSSRHGFDRGFDGFTEATRRRGNRKTFHADVLRTVRELPREPFFLFVHYFDVHAPYDPPAEFDRFRKDPSTPRTRRDGRVSQLQRLAASGKIELDSARRDRLIDLYDGGILAMDDKLGELLAAVRARTRGHVVVLVTSDHGEEFLEHGGLMHTRTLYDEVLRVPLVVAGAGVRRGARVGDMVSLLDVTPTVLSLAGVAPEGLEGRSLHDVLARDGARVPDPRPLALLTLAHDHSVALRGMRTPGTKLILDLQHGKGELYDLREDPKESVDLYPDPAFDPLERALRGLEIAEGTQLQKPDPEVVESLRALGYL
jgi:arylsulfatase A-like enzyme